MTGNLRCWPSEDVDALDCQVRAPFYDVQGDRSVAGSDVQNPGGFRKSCPARMSDSTRTLLRNTSLPCVAFKTCLALSKEPGNPIIVEEIEGPDPDSTCQRAEVVKRRFGHPAPEAPYHGGGRRAWERQKASIQHSSGRRP